LPFTHGDGNLFPHVVGKSRCGLFLLICCAETSHKVFGKILHSCVRICLGFLVTSSCSLLCTFLHGMWCLFLCL